MNNVTEQVAPDEEIASFLRAARDSVSDDMIGRLTDTATHAMDLLDRVNRSGVADALPAIAEMVRTGDLERVARYARVAGAAEDAVTDDMIGRFATLAAEATMMVDRLNTSGVTKLIDLLGQMNSTGALDRIAQRLPALIDNLELIENLFSCLAEAAKEVKSAPPPAGGLFPLLAMMRDPENQKALQFFMAVGRRMRASCVKG
ncbi:MAG TPA: DUF1641 domain-containing protein [Usitatibacter sp.]|nr:DUF1641 domain-containing protein [Usitatibacter sp.]